MAKIAGPDLTQGVAAGDVKKGAPLLGHVGKDGVLLVNLGDGYSAVGAECAHYHGPLDEGLVVGETVRCPLHHACFSLRSGEVLAAPGLNPLPRWRVEKVEDTLFVRERLPNLSETTRKAPAGAKHPESVIIIGGGAAGEAAATALRFSGYKGPVTILNAEPSLPPDRPNLSKDYLAGTAPLAWVPIRAESHYQKRDITLLRNTTVTAIDTGKKSVRTADGREFSYGALLLATGADPVRLPTPGAELPHVHYIRTVADSEGIIKGIEAGAKRVVVIGASFIGLEAAAALRVRALEVHVVGPEARPLERVLGPELGDFVRSLHEKKGVLFHLGRTATRIEATQVILSDGSTLAADMVVIGVGVRPVTALAEQAGLKLDRGVVVNEYLETSVPGVYAAGDIARWPDPHTGTALRVEHWAVAQRQAQTVARNMLGFKEAFTSVPFFWSQHYEVAINYVGHAEKWDVLEMDGDPAKDCAVSYKLGGKLMAVATISRDKQSLEVAAMMERS
ncbi:MAG TPA: FAD-dependent oxidoreductase [Gammaproteobacteria bacterium]|jgi:NADPH-dependent 2,4-dienoyl-CoA reductase/sulfur reductase-like enzyme/nitrite reductase/ring-hydroxylating ferredoxin subunit|nr:FAD-dependent oxidoreductase [Gammaproteobacteria bacterium]